MVKLIINSARRRRTLDGHTAVYTSSKLLILNDFSSHLKKLVWLLFTTTASAFLQLRSSVLMMGGVDFCFHPLGRYETDHIFTIP